MKKKENFFNEGFIFNNINLILNQIWNLKNLCIFFLNVKLLITESSIVNHPPPASMHMRGSRFTELSSHEEQEARL